MDAVEGTCELVVREADTPQFGRTDSIDRAMPMPDEVYDSASRVWGGGGMSEESKVPISLNVAIADVLQDCSSPAMKDTER